MKKVRQRWLGMAAIGIVTVLLGACGGDDSADTGSASSESVVESGVSIPADAPQRIVSLSPSHTEMLFAIGAGDQVVAVDSLSTFPEETSAVVTDLSAFEPNVEAISKYEPDLVVIADDSSGISAQLADIGIETWIGLAPTTIDEVYAQIEDLGARVGHVDEANALVAEMTSSVAEIVAGAPMLDTPLTYYHELDDTYFSVTSNTFIGSLYAMLGLRNIADATEGDTDYPQLSAEFIVSQDPDLIFLADTKCCGITADSVGARPGWEALSSVLAGDVIEMDDDIASRWGPRIVDYLRAVSDAIAAIES